MKLQPPHIGQFKFAANAYTWELQKHINFKSSITTDHTSGKRISLIIWPPVNCGRWCTSPTMHSYQNICILSSMNYIYSLSMLVPSSAYLLQPFILKLILRGPLQSILGCFAGYVRSRRRYVCGGTYLCGCGWGYVCGETCITGEHISALHRYSQCTHHAPAATCA